MKMISKSIDSEGNNNFVRIIKGSVLSIAFTVIALIIFALILAYTNMSDAVITPVVIGVAGVSILIGSMLSSIKIKKQGLINGSLVGLIYVACIYLLSSIIDKDFSLDASSAIMCFICILTGALGRNHRSKPEAKIVLDFSSSLC